MKPAGFTAIRMYPIVKIIEQPQSKYGIFLYLISKNENINKIQILKT